MPRRNVLDGVRRFVEPFRITEGRGFRLKDIDLTYLGLGIGAVVILQGLFTYAPPLQALFDTAPIPLGVWPWLVLAGVVFFLVVEAEKLIIRSLTSRSASR